MSPGGRSEQVGVLRDAIARIEGGVPSLGSSGAATRVALGMDDALALDRVLGGGLVRPALHEVLAASPGDAGATCGFALALAARFAAGKRTSVVWIIEDGAGRESGIPYAPGLAAHGLDPQRLVIVRTRNGPDTLWAMEEALRCRGLAVVIADLWRTKTYDLVASRRLVLAAQKNATPGILVPAGAAGTAPLISSAAQTRFEIAAGTGPWIASAGNRTPLPGCAAWNVRLARIRAGPDGHAEHFDWEKTWPLVWDHEEARFRDALPFRPPAVLRDRPNPPAADGRPASERSRVA